MGFIQFEEIAQKAGITDVGESWGTAIADFNNDGWADIFINNHLAVPKLYLNQQNGTFIDVFRTTLKRFQREDNHGAAWADVDNDGDVDLLQLNGAGGGENEVPNFFYESQGGKLIESAAKYNLDYPQGRGRMPLWLDYDRDGKLDLFMGVSDRPDGNAPPTLFRQTADGFEDIGLEAGITQKDGVFAQLSYLSGDTSPELLIVGEERVVLNMGAQENRDQTSELGLQDLKGTDLVIADFNNDLRPDIFQTTFQTKSDVFQDNSRRFKAFFQKQGAANREQGVDFQTTGILKFDIPAINPQTIFIGQQGFNPDSSQFQLDQTDPEALKLKESRTDPGLYVGFDPLSETWQLRWLGSRNDQLFAQVKSSDVIEALTPINFNPADALSRDTLWLNSPNGFNLSTTSNINLRTSAQSVAAGDFDNDMDIDLYLVTATKVGNPENIFYENTGNGVFKPVRNSAGAAGSTLGVGSAAATVDLDNNGFLDLVVTNGGSFLGNSRSILDDGPTEVFLNQGNLNRWIAITLDGRYSNRDGIGSRVYATTGGKTQLREQNGGTQAQIQNHSRLHFGLAKNRIVKRLQVKWTNGISQTLMNVKSNQFLDIVEGIGSGGNDIILGTSANEALSGQRGNDLIRGGLGNDILSGDAGNDRIYGNAGNDAIRGGDNSDQLYGDDGDDKLKGQEGNDQLFGGQGNDQLVGGGGTDWLFGGGGKDALRGGFGSDTFQLNPLNQGVIVLKDFKSKQDTIAIARSGYQGTLPIGKLTNSRFVQGTWASKRDHQFIYNRSQGVLSFDPDGDGLLNSIAIAKLGQGTFLNAGDIQVI